MSTLVELLASYNQLCERIVLNEGEITPEIEDEFLHLNLETSHKIDSYAFVLERLQVESEFWKKKIDSIQKIKKGIEGAEERLKKRIKDIMIAQNKKTLEGDEMTFMISKTKDRLLVDESKLPSQYWLERVERYYEKEKLREALNSGPIAGVYCEQSFALKIRPSCRKELK